MFVLIILTRSVGKIALREFAPASLPRTDTERSKLKGDLERWESELSPEMSAASTPASFWASMLHITYK